MKKFLLLSAAVLVPAAVFGLFRLPLASVIEFQARGEVGDEEIRVTAAQDENILLHDTIAGKEWRTYRFERFGLPDNIRIYFLNKPKLGDPNRLLYIRNGIVKLYKKNMFGHVLARKDLLNIDSIYRDFDGSSMFQAESMPMATVRGGITGWAGFYELYP